MGSIIHILRQGIELLLWPLDQLPPLLALTIVSVITGVVLLWMVGKTTNQKLVEKARNKMTSGIYEIRLYMDSPKRVLNAQGRLIVSSFVYVGAMIPALLAAAIPLGLLYLHLEVRYGLTPVEKDQSVVVRVELEEGTDGNLVELGAHEGLDVADAKLYLEDEAAVFFRVVPTDEKAHDLKITLGEETVTKRIAVRGSGAMPAPDRLSGVALLWQIGDESPLGGAIRGVSLVHPPLERSWLGIPWWWGFWLLIATVAALGLRRRMDVAI